MFPLKRLIGTSLFAFVLAGTRRGSIKGISLPVPSNKIK